MPTQKIEGHSFDTKMNFNLWGHLFNNNNNKGVCVGGEEFHIISTHRKCE